MGKKSKKRNHSPSFEKLQKKIRKIQEQLNKKLEVTPELDGIADTAQHNDLHAVEIPENSYVTDSDSPCEEEDSDKLNKGKNPMPKIQEETEQTNDDVFVDLDDETLEILGDNHVGKAEEFKFHPRLAETWKKVLLDGLGKENKASLLKLYPRKGNCPITTPKLNPEVEATVNDTVKRRDSYLALDQDLCGASLSSLGKVINSVLNDNVDRRELLVALTDSGKFMCELFKQLSKARKAFIYPGLDKKAKTLLDKSETDEFLFGSSLSERVKTAKSVEKVGLSLKSQVTDKKTPFRPRSALNWRGPSVKSTNQSQTGYVRRMFPNQRPFHFNKPHEKNRPAGPSQSRQSTSQSNATTTQK